MNLILTILVTVLIFGFLIAVHELGHYLVARAFKVGIREYSIGMGPKLLQKKGKYNKFTLRLLPIGGYVDMVGEQAGDDGSDPEDEGKAPLNSKPVWQRMLIVLAGPFTNILIGLIIMAIIVVCQSSIYGTKIDSFYAGNVSGRNMLYLTEDYGDFQKNDIIFGVDGRLAAAGEGLSAFLAEHGEKAEVIVFRRNSNQVLNPINVEGVSFSELKLSYDEEEKLYKVEEDGGDFKKGDLIHTVDGVDITKAPLAEGDAKAQLDALLSKYSGSHTVGVVRYYSVFIEEEMDSADFDSFGDLPLYVDDMGNLKLSEDTGDLLKNGVITAVNGTEVEAGLTVESFGEKYGQSSGELTVTYRWYINCANPIVIEDVALKDLPLAVSGALLEGDVIKEVGSYTTRVFSGLSYGIFNEGTEPTDLIVIRDGKETLVENVVFLKGSQQGVLYGAMDFYVAEEEKTFGNVCYNAFFQPVASLTMTLDSVLQTFTGKYGIEALSGPVGIGEQVGEAITAESGGGEYLFTLIVLISLSLGVCNLLPLPVLDGGRFLLYAIEAVRRKPLPEKVEQIIMAISWVLVMGLMIFVMFKDVIGLF